MLLWQTNAMPAERHGMIAIHVPVCADRVVGPLVVYDHDYQYDNCCA